MYLGVKGTRVETRCLKEAIAAAQTSNVMVAWIRLYLGLRPWQWFREKKWKNSRYNPKTKSIQLTGVYI